MKNILKGKIKNKFILSIITIIILIVGIQGYISFSLLGVDTNSYVLLIEGNAKLNAVNLEKNEKEKLETDDTIETFGDNSIAVIEWGDGSLTRLGGESKIIVNELDVEKDLSKINISLTLENGKTWSNVVSFMGEESYFKQNFEDLEASVRGTVFDVDLTKDYIYVADHEVKLKKGDKEVIVRENTAFDIKTFSLIEIQKFFNTLRDKAWEDINTQLDKQYFIKLKAELLEKFSKESVDSFLSKNISAKAESLNELEVSISEFSNEKKQETYSVLLEQYQKLNFVKAEDEELFETKNTLKRLLISTAGEEDKKSLVKYSIYDLKDAINSENINIDGIKDSLSLLGENKEILSSVDTDILDGVTIIPEGLQDAFTENMETINSLFGENLSNLKFGDFSLDDAQDLIDSGKQKAIETFDKTKDSVGNLLENFKN